MKMQDYSLTLIYGIVGIIVFIFGVVFLFLGNSLALIFGLIFIIAGGLLSYMGIRAIFKVKKQIAEQKEIDEKTKRIAEQAKIEMDTAIKNNICPKCGEKITEEDSFCRKCGFKIK